MNSLIEPYQSLNSFLNDVWNIVNGKKLNYINKERKLMKVTQKLMFCYNPSVHVVQEMSPHINLSSSSSSNNSKHWQLLNLNTMSSLEIFC